MKEVDVLNYLLTDSDITDLIGDRISTAWLKKETLRPAITCNYSSDIPINTFAGEADVEHEIITINLWCGDKVSLNTLYSAVKAKMNGWAIRLNKADLSDEEQSEYRFAIDYSVRG